MNERLKIVFRLLCLTPQTVSKEIGVSMNMIYRYLNGENKPSHEVLKKFCKAYYINDKWLVTGMGDAIKTKELERIRQAKQILKEVSLIKIERNLTYRQIEDELGLYPKYFTDLKKGKITMPPEKLNLLRLRYGIGV
jgi:transcriptional regulator with XRE-family HTH domain